MSEAFEYSGAFQNRILRVLSEDPTLCASVEAFMQPSMFDGRVRQWAASAMFSHVKRHGARPDADALRIRLRRDLQTKRLLSEYEAPVAAMIEKLQRPVKDRSFVRDEMWRFSKLKLYEDVVRKSVKHHKDQDLDAIDSELQRVLDMNLAMSGGAGMFYASAGESRAKYRKTDVAAGGISTGTKLDNFIRHGGLWPKSISCVVAGSGCGKTSMMVSMSRAAIVDSGKKVLYVTLDEADEFAIGDRFDAAFSGVALNSLIEEEQTVADALGDLERKLGEFLVIKEFPPATITVPMLRSYIRQLESKSFYPDLVVIDYADLMLPTVSHDNDYDDQGNIYVDFRKMAIEMKNAGLTAAQLNREGLKRKTATMAHIGDSMKKAHRCDLLFVFNQTPRERKQGLGRLLLEKNRGGSTKHEIEVRVDWATQTMSDR